MPETYFYVEIGAKNKSKIELRQKNTGNYAEKSTETVYLRKKRSQKETVFRISAENKLREQEKPKLKNYAKMGAKTYLVRNYAE